MITVYPTSGFKYITPFTVSISPSGTAALINWNDGTFSQSSTATHVFSAAGLYPIYAGNCAATSALTVSVYNGPFFENTINVVGALSSYTGCLNSFTLNVSSVTDNATVFLYASGSNSNAYSDNSFWSHLNPQWKFTDDQFNPIPEIKMDLNPVHLSGLTLGYAGSATVYYYDDMPGKPNLFFTMELSEGINSRVFSSVAHTVSADIPSELVITADGIEPINATQWADISIPYIVSVKGQHSNNILHFATGNLLATQPLQGCNGIPASQYTFLSDAINLTDENCFNTGGYSRSTLTVPTSAIPVNTLQVEHYTDACGNPTPELQEYTEIQNNPFSVSIAASALVYVNGTPYTLTGNSNAFNVFRLEKFHEFYRKGEDKNVYDLLKQYSHFDLEDMPVLDSYMSAVAGPGDTLGKVYDKIVNFNLDHNDIDLCTIESLANMGVMLDNPIDTFDLSFPEEMRRMMNFFSMPLNKLIGTRCSCNTNFAACVNCKGSNICGLCGFDKKLNVGKLLQLDDVVNANTTILVRQNGNTVYDFFLVPTTSKVRDIPGIDLADHCLFEWDQSSQNNPVESVIDYKNLNTTISRSLSSVQDWIGNGGVMEEILNRILTENIIK